MRRSRFLVLMMTVCLMSFVFALDAERYDYKLSLTPECSEYMGFVSFEFPNEFEKSFTIYSEDEIFVSEGSGARLDRNVDWFVNSLAGYDVREVENIFDGDFRSDLIVSDSGVTLLFQSPERVQVDKIIIDTKDSLINSFEVSSGELVDFDLQEDKFHYELDLNGFMGDEVRIVLNFDGVLKIREVSFFEEIDYGEETYGYFYVDDDCNRTRDVYFGRFGESNFLRGAKLLPVFFDVKKSLLANSLYDDDFDDDGVLNEVDNCLDVANSDQKDIDYNEAGDACDDFDRDGVLNVDDNCLKVSNRGQGDGDGDGVGDACDDEDDRFFEKNVGVLILLVIIIVGVFGFLTYKILKH